jgi:hypothetical protein
MDAASFLLDIVAWTDTWIWKYADHLFFLLSTASGARTAILRLRLG